MLAIDAVGHGRRGQADTGRELPERLPIVRPIGDQGAIGTPLEHKITGGGHRTGIPHTRQLDFPNLLLRDRIPGHQRTRIDGERHVVTHHIERRIELEFRRAPSNRVKAFVGEQGGEVDDRDIGEPGPRIERHRMPVVHAEGARIEHFLAVFVAGALRFDGAAGLHIDVRRPGHVNQLVGGNKLAVRTIEHIEETVLRCMQQRLDRLLINRQIREDHVHIRVVVPGFTWHRLIVPDVLAGIGIERDDRAQKKIIAAAGAAHALIPGRAVAGTDIEAIEFRVVGDAVPNRAATPVLPPFALPGLGDHFLGSVFEAIGGIAGHRVEAPNLFASGRIVGRDIAAQGPPLGATIADQDLVVERARCTVDEVGLLDIDGQRAPNLLAGLGIDADQAAIGGCHIHLALPIGDAAVRVPHDAQPVAGGLDHLWIVGPQSFLRFEIDGDHHAVAAGKIHHAIDDQRCGQQ